MTKPVLVTGAGGCIGAWTVWQLQDSGTPVVAFDLSDNKQRLALLHDAADAADSIVWETGDIADAGRVMEVVDKHCPAAIIHLAALQVPFCIADPLKGAQVNVAGCVNVFAAAKACGVPVVIYASSVAATAMAEPSSWKQTLYGAYKVCNEHTARVYWNDANIASVGIRPGVVYGPARDRGMSAAPTFAMLAAALKRPYVIPFTGNVGFVHAREAAAAFIRAAITTTTGAQVFELNGICKTVEEVVDNISARLPDSNITCEGASLPFPSGLSDEPLRECIGEYWRSDFDEGLDDTLRFFAQRIKAGRIGLQHLDAST